MNELQNEWAILHQNIEKYEQFSLLIKLLSLTTCLLSIAYSIGSGIILYFIFLFWLQDAIWKTFQKRLEARILDIELDLQKPDKSNDAFQLYSNWQQNRTSAFKLVAEYLLSAVKPTVAYPYIFLIGLILLLAYFQTN